MTPLESLTSEIGEFNLVTWQWVMKGRSGVCVCMGVWLVGGGVGSMGVGGLVIEFFKLVTWQSVMKCRSGI